MDALKNVLKSEGAMRLYPTLVASAVALLAIAYTSIAFVLDDGRWSAYPIQIGLSSMVSFVSLGFTLRRHWMMLDAHAAARDRVPQHHERFYKMSHIAMVTAANIFLLGIVVAQCRDNPSRYEAKDAKIGDHFFNNTYKIAGRSLTRGLLIAMDVIGSAIVLLQLILLPCLYMSNALPSD